MIKAGLDVFIASPIVRRKLGLLTNIAAMTAEGHTSLRAIRDCGCEVATLFAPEHGYFADGAPGEPIADAMRGQIMIRSLYSGVAKVPQKDELRGLDAVVIDLQDTGNRWYTFLATIQTILRVSVEANVPVILLDRPNPQGGLIVEGNLADPRFFSIVAPAAFPVRYGLTLGEAALHLNAGIGSKLTVISMQGWQRDMLFEDTGLAWSAPSPGIPHARTTILYTGLCLLEGLNVSEGRGTALPFEQFGSPFIDGDTLAGHLNALHLPGLSFRPTAFRPSISKYAGERCYGVRVIPEDWRAIRGFSAGLHIIETLFRLYRDHLIWIENNGRKVFDNLTGTDQIRATIVEGRPVEDILSTCDKSSGEFQAKSRQFWLYPGKDVGTHGA